MRFEGVFVAVTTPFKANGEVCYESYRKHLAWLSNNGVSGFVSCGTTGEGATLTHSEWVKITEITIDFARNEKKQVIAGCGSNSTQVVLELMEKARGLGADAALVVTPYYNKPTQRGLIAHYDYLAKSSKLPIVLYNVPGRTNVNLTVDTAKRLFENSNIVGIKEASGNHAQWVQLAREIDFSKRSFMAGDDDAFATILSLGGSGIISASANVAPQEFVQIYKLFRSGQPEKAFALQTKVQNLVKAMFLETNPAPAKYALKLRLGMEPHLRLPLVDVTADTAKQIELSLKELELI